MSESTSSARLAATLRARAQTMRPGERLASTREISARHRVSPVTVSRALAVLRAEGVLVTRPGSGTYVAAPRAGGPPEEVDTSWQTVALGDRTIDSASRGRSSWPRTRSGRSRWPAATRIRRSCRPGRWRPPSAEPRAARTPASGRRSRASPACATWFAASVAAGLTADDVLSRPAPQSALSAASGPSHRPGPRSSSSRRPTSARSPRRGRRISRRCRSRRPRRHPASTSWPRRSRPPGRACPLLPTDLPEPDRLGAWPERRRRLLAVARDAGAFVIEDDYARHLGHERPAPPPLIADDVDGRVVHIASLTKSTSPNLRIGALIAHGPVAERAAVAAHRRRLLRPRGRSRRPRSSSSARRRGGAT